MSGPLWTTADRRELGRLFDGASPDLHRAAEITREWCGALAATFPSTHRGVEILPLLVHKLAGYNADLFTHAVRVLRSDAAARAMLASRPSPHAVFPFEDPYLAEHAFAARLRERGGSFVAFHESTRDGAALERRYPARCAASAFESFEFDALAAPSPLEFAPSLAGEGAESGACEESATPSVTSCRAAVPTTLFVASMNNYLQPMTPVMAELLRRGQRVALLCPRAAGAWPQARHIPPGVERVHIEDLITPLLAAFHRDERSRIAAAWERSADLVRRCFVLGPIDAWPLVRRDVARFILDYLPSCALLIEIARRLRVSMNVRACVVARLRRATESTLGAALRSAGVPVTMLVHGHISTFPERSFDTGGFEADRVCVWGEAQKFQVLGTHAPPAAERVVVVGNPAWDGLISRRGGDSERREARALIARDLALDPRRLWAVLTAQDITAPQFPDVVRAFASEPRACLIVKPHPAESPDWYRRRCADLPGAVVLEHGRCELHDLLRAADLTLTFSSTTNLESLILGTPVVTYAFGALATQDRAAYLEECDLPLARTGDELTGILRRAADDADRFRSALMPAVERALRTFVGNYPDAGAARRVADLIRPAGARASLAGAA